MLWLSCEGQADVWEMFSDSSYLSAILDRQGLLGAAPIDQRTKRADNFSPQLLQSLWCAHEKESQDRCDLPDCCYEELQATRSYFGNNTSRAWPWPRATIDPSRESIGDCSNIFTAYGSPSTSFFRTCISSAACCFRAPSVAILTSLQPAVNLLLGYFTGKPVQDHLA